MMQYTVNVSVWLPQLEDWLLVCELTEVPPCEIADFVRKFNEAFLTSIFDYKITLTMEVPRDA